MSKEGILSILIFKIRQSGAIQSFEILRLDILRFCGSLFFGSYEAASMSSRTAPTLPLRDLDVSSI